MDYTELQSNNEATPINPMDTLPAFKAKSFYRWVARTVDKYFENPEVQRRYEIWKAERDKEENYA